MDKSVKIRIGFGVGFCALVAVYFFYVEGNKVPTITTKEIALDKIYKVEFQHAGSNVLLFRDEENWLVGPRSYRADKKAVLSTVEYFSKKFSLELVSRDPGYYLAAGLDAGAMRTVRIFGKPVSPGGEHILLKEVKVGKVHPSSFECVYVLGADGYVYKISSYGFATEAARDVSHFRTKKIFPTDIVKKGKNISIGPDSLEFIGVFGVSFNKKDITEEQKKALEKIFAEGAKEGTAKKAESVKFLWKSDTDITLNPQKSEEFLKNVFSHDIRSESYIVDGVFRESELKKNIVFEFSCQSVEGQKWSFLIYSHPEKAMRDKGNYILSSSELQSLILLTPEESLTKSIPKSKKDWVLSI